MELLGQVHRHDAPWAACFPGLVVALIAIVVLLVLFGQQASHRQMLSRVAAHLGGRVVLGGLFQSGDRVQFEYQGQRAELRFSHEGRNRHFTHLEIQWFGPNLRCEVYPESFFSSLGKLLGMVDLVIGSPAFDRQFIITGDDHAAIKSLLNAQVQAATFSLAQYVHGMHVRFSPRSLTVTCGSRMTEFDLLIAFIGRCRHLYDAALATQASGIEYLDGSSLKMRESAGPGRCMVCGEALETEVVYCRSCRTPHHRDCWSYSGGCSTYGCREKSFTR